MVKPKRLQSFQGRFLIRFRTCGFKAFKAKAPVMADFPRLLSTLKTPLTQLSGAIEPKVGAQDQSEDFPFPHKGRKNNLKGKLKATRIIAIFFEIFVQNLGEKLYHEICI